MHRMEVGKFTRCQHRLATTATAVTDEVHSVANIVAELDKLAFMGLLQKIQSFRPIDHAHMAMPVAFHTGMVLVIIE